VSSQTPPPPTEPPSRGSDPHPIVFLRKQVRRLQDGLAARLGIDPADREVLVGEMISRQEGDALSYWIQIFLAIGISTLGLVLDSTGVVIGAMLISPLMTPIVGLGMGLTTGSPFLTLRSLVRVGASVLVIIAFAAVLTKLLPFREVTGEIAARTAPTLIDLGIASFCALAAGFTTVRHSSDTVAAAAGTAIGIALVPPLCVSGFGVGVASTKIALGATLLFTSNLCAILFFSVTLFFCIGYNQTDVSLLESRNVKVSGRIGKVAGALRRAFETRYGPLMRFLLPLALVSAVYIPLSRALTEVAWKVRMRTEVAAILEDVTAEDYAMRSSFTVEHGQVSIRLVLVASPEHAKEVETELRTRVAAVASSIPEVQVHAVPDFASLQRAADAAATPVISPVESTDHLDLLRQRIEERLARWPRGADRILYWGVGFEGETCVLEVAHVGTAGGEFLTLLEETLGSAVEQPVTLRERAVTLSTWTADNDDLLHWLPQLATALGSATVPGVSACVTRGPHTKRVPAPLPDTAPPPTPVPPDPAPGTEAPAPVTPPAPPVPTMVNEDLEGAAAAAALLRTPRGTVTITEGAAWSVQVVQGPCPSEPAG